MGARRQHGTPQIARARPQRRPQQAAQELREKRDCGEEHARLLEAAAGEVGEAVGCEELQRGIGFGEEKGAQRGDELAADLRGDDGDRSGRALGAQESVKVAELLELLRAGVGGGGQDGESGVEFFGGREGHGRGVAVVVIFFFLFFFCEEWGVLSGIWLSGGECGGVERGGKGRSG